MTLQMIMILVMAMMILLDAFNAVLWMCRSIYPVHSMKT